MARQIQGSQRDFSYGEVDIALKRADDHPARKAGLRQMSNMRILNSGGIQNRPGRSALFPANVSSRIEEVTMSPGNVFKIAFGASGGNGEIRIINSLGAQVAAFGNQGSGALLPWTLLNVKEIGFAPLRLSIYITFPGMRPQVLSWDGVSTWSIADFTELVVGGQKRTFFYRLSPQNITIVPSAQVGSGVVINASQPIFTAAHVGTYIRYINRQLLITNVPGPYPSLTCGATVEEPLPGHQTLTFANDPTFVFSVGDVVRGTSSGSVGQVYQTQGSPTNAVTIQLLNTSSTPAPSLSPFIPSTGAVAFTTSDTLVGQGGSMPVSSASTIGVPAPTTIWDEEVMNAMHGYPASCFVDQFRVGFCDFPAIPSGIGWSAVNSPTDCYVGSDPSSAMFEIAPDKVRVRYVVPGPESSEFVFCDRRVYYIPISPNNPLKPGGVGFQILSGDGAAQVQPRVAQEAILYVNAGQNSIMAVIATGAYYRPFNTKNLSEFHAHLFNSIVAIAAPSADGTFNERYAYVLNGDGSIAVGKYDPQSITGNKPVIGWGPWSGVGTIKWIAAHAADVLFTTSYFGFTTCEVLDDTQYLDAAVSVNALPAAFAPPSGQGPLWWLASKTVSLMDQVTRSMGTYQIDANGFIVPQNNAGENLAAASLVAGQPWTLTAEPFSPDAAPGADEHQRMLVRRISYFTVYVIHSTGFMFAKLFSSKQTATSPPLGTIMNIRRVPAWNLGDDATKPPLSRETAESWRPSGLSYDPRVAIIKDTPGPLFISEIAMEITL